MIETLIEAERALTHGLVDQAERLYRVVRESDPKNSIAVMGLARVALERGDDATAYLHGRAALAIDPDNPAAKHLVMRLTEVAAARGETPPDVDESESAPEVASPAEVASAPAPAQAPTPAKSAPARSAPARSAPLKAPTPQRPGVVKRLLGRGRRSR